jgi:PAS domain-containing protein
MAPRTSKKIVESAAPVAAAPVAPQAAHAQSTPPVAPRRPRRRAFSAFMFLALVAVSSWAYFLYRENRELRDPEAQARRVVEAMSAHIILPEGEVPGIFPIDKSKATEPFFRNAQNGDILVVYRSTQQAFVYSPSRKILVNAGVLVVNPDQEEVPSGRAEEPAEEEAPSEEEAPEVVEEEV